MDTKGIGQRITKLKKALSLNQKEFSTLMNVSVTAISNWECGIQKPSTENLVIIANLANVSLDWLITGQESQAGMKLTVADQGKHWQTGEISATIAPGTEAGISNIKDNRRRPTVKLTHLRWIVEWMDKYFIENEEQALLFYEQLKDTSPSFVEFIETEKKTALQR